MFPSTRAPVRPRVLLPQSTVALPLEDEVRSLLERRRGGLVQVLGGPGSGKTTALCHLAGVLGPDDPVVLLDGAPSAGFETSEHTLTIYASEERLDGRATVAVYHLAPWSEDEWIEYLLARHPHRCASVIGRLREAGDVGILPRVPELWAAVLDRLAADEGIRSVRKALEVILGRELPTSGQRLAVRSLCLRRVHNHGSLSAADAAEMRRHGCSNRLVALARHEIVRLFLASEQVAADLLSGAPTLYLGVRLPRELVRATARAISDAPNPVAVLAPLLSELPDGRQATVASILHAMGTGWRPEGRRLPDLTGAYLDGAYWAKVELTGVKLMEADLSDADLRGACLDRAIAPAARFCGGMFQRSSLTGIQAKGATFANADLFDATADEANFTSADFEGATLERARLRWAKLNGANLTGARLRGADLTGAVLTGAKIDDADFSDANFFHATLIGLELARAVLRGAKFTEADLSGCNLEDVALPGADFARANLSGALLTSSSMPGATFVAANLFEAGLADVNWENADLRGANLCRASFHLGSTRSGTLITPIASEGTRTGYYTDDFEEQSFKSPEDIRKANLCGADLRGADVTAGDFYLVDLRGAKYDGIQAAHFRRCGAILESRVG
jgi:uncharacterized protein YjbI with pentapeptide repeats